MKKLIITCIGLLFAINSYGQDLSVSVAPYSFKAWGQANSFSEISVGYSFIDPVQVGVFDIHLATFSIHYFHPNRNEYWIKSVKKGSHPDAVSTDEISLPESYWDSFFEKYPPNKFEYMYSGFTQSSFAISYAPVSVADILNLGIIVSHRGFPTEHSVNYNFLVEAGYSFSKFRISYVHISNGFGLQHPLNLGYDSLRVSYFFK